MKAVILAGGKGARLMPYTTIFPKPLVPVGNRPILDIVLQQLAYYGFDDIVLSVGHLAELIQAYCYSQSEKYSSINISYVREEHALGTAGAVKLIPELGDSPFLVMNGDVLTTLDYSKMMAYHREHGSMLTVGLYEKRMKIDLGVVDIDKDGYVVAYVEKPEKTFTVSSGINVYSPEVLHYIEPNEFLDFPTLVRRLLDHGERVSSYQYDGYWLDIGNQEDYIKAQEAFAQLEKEFLPTLDS